MAFFIGAAQAGIESANAANRMNPRDRTGFLIDPLFHLFNLSQAFYPDACDRPRILRTRSQTHLGRELLLIRFGRSRVEMGSWIEKKIPPKSHYGPAMPGDRAPQYHRVGIK